MTFLTSPSPRLAFATLLCLMLIGSMLMAGCSTADKVKPPPVPSLIASPGKRSITVSELNAAASIVLEPAQELVVRLALDATQRPEWSLIEFTPGVLTTSGSSFERARRDANINPTDAVGNMVWVFKPVAAGEVTLKFDLRLPRSLEPAVRSVTYKVTAR